MPIFFDAGRPSPPPGRELLAYELVDIPGGEGCERLPLAPGLLAPLDRSELTCTRHTQCPPNSLCSARVGCSNAPEACDPTVISTWCSSDQCQLDAHCPSGFRCRCEGAQKECVDAKCSDDSDCGQGQVCRLTWVVRTVPDEQLTCNGDVKHYACTTPMDECMEDQDCPLYNARCGYDRPRNRFACLPCGWRVP